MPSLPTVTQAQKLAAERICLTLDIPSHLPVFEGHFPGRPVVPGVAQIDWAVHFAREHLACAGAFSGLDNNKFLHVIVPPAQVALTLEWQAETHCLAFRYSADAGKRLYSSGTLHFKP